MPPIVTLAAPTVTATPATSPTGAPADGSPSADPTANKFLGQLMTALKHLAKGVTPARTGSEPAVDENGVPVADAVIDKQTIAPAAADKGDDQAVVAQSTVPEFLAAFGFGLVPQVAPLPLTTSATSAAGAKTASATLAAPTVPLFASPVAGANLATLSAAPTAATAPTAPIAATAAASIERDLAQLLNGTAPTRTPAPADLAQVLANGTPAEPTVAAGASLAGASLAGTPTGGTPVIDATQARAAAALTTTMPALLTASASLAPARITGSSAGSDKPDATVTSRLAGQMVATPGAAGRGPAGVANPATASGSRSVTIGGSTPATPGGAAPATARGSSGPVSAAPASGQAQLQTGIPLQATAADHSRNATAPATPATADATAVAQPVTVTSDPTLAPLVPPPAVQPQAASAPSAPVPSAVVTGPGVAQQPAGQQSGFQQADSDDRRHASSKVTESTGLQIAPAPNPALIPTAVGPATPVATPLTAAAQASAVVSQIANQSDLYKLPGNKGLRIQLHPEDLGGVQVTVSYSPLGGVELHIDVEHASTGTLVQAGWTELRNALVSQGISADRLVMNVTSSATAGQGNPSGNDNRSDPGLTNFSQTTQNGQGQSGQQQSGQQQSGPRAWNAPLQRTSSVSDDSQDVAAAPAAPSRIDYRA